MNIELPTIIYRIAFLLSPVSFLWGFLVAVNNAGGLFAGILIGILTGFLTAIALPFIFLVMAHIVIVTIEFFKEGKK